MPKIAKEPVFYTIEESLMLMLKKSKQGPLPIQTMMELLSGKGRFLFLILLCLPFCQPIQLPGLSTPFGFMIFFIGIRVAFNRYLWLPAWLKRKTISSKVMERVATMCLWVFKKIRKISRPRYPFLCHDRTMMFFNGSIVALLGVFLAIPFPIPLSNMPAAWIIFLISAGLMEDDGLFLIAGYVIFVLTALLIGYGVYLLTI